MRTALLLFSTGCLPDCYALALAPPLRHQLAFLPREVSKYRGSRLDLIHSMGYYSSLNTQEAFLESSISKFDCYRIEKVNTKRRALDVKVFRGFTLPPNEFISEHNRAILNGTASVARSDVVLSEEDAVNLSMPGYDEYGRYTKLREHQNDYEQEVYFTAVYCPELYTNQAGKTETNNNINTQLFDRTNGVVGVVSAQLRHRSPLIAGSSVNSTEHHTANPAVKIPYPHLYLANMRVHDLLRRKGIGQGLLSSVVEYAKTLSSEHENNLPIVLSVDIDNTGAVSMYEKFGFEYIERNDNFCMMVFWT